MATQADVDRLDKAIALGVLRVSVEGKDVTFDDVDGLRLRRKIIADQLAAANGTPRRRYHRAYYSKGLL